MAQTVSRHGSSTRRPPMYTRKEKGLVLALTLAWTAYLSLHIFGGIALFGTPFVDQLRG